MRTEPAARTEPQPVPLARWLTGLSLVTDLARDLPLESAIRTCLFSLELAAATGVDPRATFYVALLRFLGCTAYAHELTHQLRVDEREVHHLAILHALEGRAGRSALSDAAIARSIGGRLELVAAMGDPVHRRQMGASQCEAAARFAERLGLGPEVSGPLRDGFERWNGAGVPCGRAGSEIDPVARVVHGGYLVELALRGLSPGDAQALVRAAGGEVLEPAVSAAALDLWPRLVELAGRQTVWDELTARAPVDLVPPDRFDSVAAAFGDFADLKSVYRLGHSPAVAALARDAANRMGLGVDAHLVYLAGLVHDLGLVSVSTATLDKPGPLSMVERERVRLHPYHTVRILSACPDLRDVCGVAGAHHERVDGSGYPMSTRAISVGGRLLAAADTYVALREARPYRPAFPEREARAILLGAARDGQLDAGAVSAVLSASGAPARAVPAAGPSLTPRQLEVLRLIALGRSEKEVAAELALSPRTVHHHVTHIYERLGVSSRVAVALFAVEHGLLPGGSLPTV
ncbi:MAG: HD domain-containing phosphohydrolase [Myxococcota bacterium]